MPARWARQCATEAAEHNERQKRSRAGALGGSFSPADACVEPRADSYAGPFTHPYTNLYSDPHTDPDASVPVL
eukprot:15462669-Alexandrium_andersonii.AAC.1